MFDVRFINLENNWCMITKTQVHAELYDYQSVFNNDRKFTKCNKTLSRVLWIKQL